MVLALALGLPMAAHGTEQASDPQARRRELREERARNAARINVLKASDKEIEGALGRLDANVRAQQAQVASARQAADVASQAADAARNAEAQTAARLADLRDSMRAVAVNAYIRGPSQEAMLPLEAGSLSRMATKRYLMDLAVGRGTELADELRSTREDLGTQRLAADEARRRAATRKAEVEGRLGEVEQALEMQREVASAVEIRLERALAEADSLVALDRQLASEIVRRQAALAARIASTPRPARASRGAPRSAASVGITSVRGISVAGGIAEQVEGMLVAAEAAGFSLGGGGYRNSAGEIATRRANCGSSDYDIYERPADQCSPPTARPGQSMHEQGLAIDLTWNGALVSSRSAVFRWLRSNAGRFGLSNLPGEAWHWSTTGN